MYVKNKAHKVIDDDGRKNPKRAQLISKPVSPVDGQPGETIFADLVIKNGGLKPYKDGFSIASCYSSDLMKQQFEEFSMDLEQVKGGE